ncbi:hypothetical protein ABEU86_03480 [Pseudomonas paraversuta]|uniref:hypothetical protein n=1 Tax=Pseudomonas paraversuta TaxID=2750624 RepID=UPI003D2D3416
MSFKLLHRSIDYRAHMEATNGGGFCFGQTWLWMSEIISGVSGDLSPPNFLTGGKIQAEYEAHYDACGGSLPFVDVKVSELRLKVPDKCLVQRSAQDHESSVELVNEFSLASGENAVIYMSWMIAGKCPLLKVMRNSSHAMGLLKLKNNGKIYLFDANHGVLEWVREPGVKLKKDIKKFMLQSPGRSVLIMRSAMMLSTNSDIPLNFEHVIV